MNKFKVGDVVERVLGVETYLVYQGSATGTVTAVSPQGGLQIDGWMDTANNRYPWHSENFVHAAKPADDPLPPAPTSTLYFNSEATKGNDQRLRVSVGFDDCVDIMVIPRTNSPALLAVSVRYGLGVGLNPDGALQLAHDIRRMAMALKRKEKE